MAVFTVQQERANSLTHGIGLLLSIIGAAYLLFTSRDTSPVLLGGVGVFSLTMIITYLTSTLYHGVSEPGRKFFFRKLDHVSIYLLIGGSYTPFLILYLNNPAGWRFMGILWALVGVGIIYKWTCFLKFPRFSIAYYVFLGWLAVFIAKPLYELMPPMCLALLAGGGLCYTIGIVFFVWKKYKYHHAIWHLFVMAGTFCHYLAVLNCVKSHAF